MVPTATTGFDVATLLTSQSARVGPIALGCSVETLFFLLWNEIDHKEVN